MCYVETKALDGETNLKHKLVDKTMSKIMNNGIESLSGVLICEKPNDRIYSFEGSLYLDEVGRSVPIGIENVLLRGSNLINTEAIIGMIVYTGHDTKVMKNSTNARFKKSQLDRNLNKHTV